jgi:RNase P/RNase MRP subunit p30
VAFFSKFAIVNHLEVHAHINNAKSISKKNAQLDPGRKFAFFNNVKRLVEVTRGQNLIFSSEGIRALEIRRPADLRIL